MSGQYPTIKLTESEIIIAGSVCVQRYAQNLTNGKKEMYGAEDRFGFQYMMDGALGEMAAAKWLGRYWNGSVGNLLAADVGDFQIRTTRRSSAELILHDADKDADIFLLLYLFRDMVAIAGWCYGIEGKQPEYWRDDIKRPAYFVPHHSMKGFGQEWETALARKNKAA